MDDETRNDIKTLMMTLGGLVKRMDRLEGAVGRCVDRLASMKVADPEPKSADTEGIAKCPAGHPGIAIQADHSASRVSCSYNCWRGPIRGACSDAIKAWNDVMGLWQREERENPR